MARMLGIQPPSVSAWREKKRIPDDKLARLAPAAEAAGLASRKELLPDHWRQIWPDLVVAGDPESNMPATPVPPAQAAMKSVATGEGAHA